MIDPLHRESDRNVDCLVGMTGYRWGTSRFIEPYSSNLYSCVPLYLRGTYPYHHPSLDKQIPLTVVMGTGKAICHLLLLHIS
jgi:hypothetical protein